MYRLRDLREDADIKQHELAKLLDCDQATYSRYENGKFDIWNTAVEEYPGSQRHSFETALFVSGFHKDVFQS